MSSEAQKKYWLDSSLHPVNKKGEASYYIISQKTDSILFTVELYHLNESLLMKGKSIDEQGLQLHGYSVWYFEDGTIESEGNYNYGSKRGIWKRYSKTGEPRPDKEYSGTDMNNYIFNSARVMPKPPAEIESFEKYIYSEVVKSGASGVFLKSSVKVQFVVYMDGHIGSLLLDNRLSNNDNYTLGNIIMAMPDWIPGSNGTQNINVRVDYELKIEK